MKIAIAADHGGYDLKEALKDSFSGAFDWLDLGTHSAGSVDYPDFAQAMAKTIEAGDAEKGILICGTGIGISIAANRFPAIRAGLCTNGTMARLTRAHNDANVLVLGARIIGFETARDCVEIFMNTAFEGGRHQRRVDKINNCC